jgi:hypothetical protein
MAHGHPDYGESAPVSTIFTQLDMGELAARLGSPVTFDRRGNVIWMDDFEGNIEKWYQGWSGVGASVALSTESARSGVFSVKLITGDALNNLAQIIRYLPYPVVGRNGFEISFTVGGEDDCYLIRLNLFTGTQLLWSQIRYESESQKLEYLDENETYQTIASNLKLHAYTKMFHTLKLVTDFSTRKYAHVILNEKTYDLSAYALKVQASTTAPCLAPAFTLVTRRNSAVYCYADDVIITRNEP